MDELGQISTGQGKKPVKGCYTGLRPRQQNYEVSDSEGSTYYHELRKGPMLGFFPFCWWRMRKESLFLVDGTTFISFPSFL